MKIIAGYSSLNLTHALCEMLSLQPIEVAYKRFADGEIEANIEPAHIQGEECLLVYSLSSPVNDDVIALLLTIDALKRNGAQKITVCLPYLAYARQKHTVSLISSLMHVAGADHCITIDPHSDVNGIVPIRVLSTTQLFVDHISISHNLDNLVIVSPDRGGIDRCMQVHTSLGLKTDLVIIDKVRTDGLCIADAIHGDVRGKRCIIVDDIIDTGATLCSAAAALMQHGALEVFAYCTHGVLSGAAMNRVQESPIKKLVITDTIAPHADTLGVAKIEVISVVGLLVNYVDDFLMNEKSFK